MAPNLQICPLKQLYQLLAQSDTAHTAAVISTSWDLPDPARLRGIPYVCRQYRDIDFEGSGAFSDADAEAFAGFIRRIGSDSRIRRVYVCCDAAVSRSPAVYAAMGRWWKLEDWDRVFQTPRYSPNMYVFRKLSGALGMDLSDEECDRLIHSSRKAFREAFHPEKR